MGARNGAVSSYGSTDARARAQQSVWQAAQSYARRGLPVFPCERNGKRPLTPRGLHGATTDAGVIDAWARRWPSANLGLPCGTPSGLLCLDIDQKKGVDGQATMRALARDLGVLPATLTASTPSGGQHLLFLMPAADIPNSAGKVCGFDAPGFDVRSTGGYIVVAPSVIDGVPYQWTHRAPAELPAMWARALTRPEPVAAPEPYRAPLLVSRPREEKWVLRALESEARELAAAPEGTRNDALWKAAAGLGGLIHTGAIEPADVRRALGWACSQWGSRTPKKDAQTLENGLAFGIARPREVRVEG